MTDWAIYNFVVGVIAPIAWILAAVVSFKVRRRLGPGPATWVAAFGLLMALSAVLNAAVPKCWTPWAGNPPAWFLVFNEIAFWLSQVAVVPFVVGMILMAKQKKEQVSPNNTPDGIRR